MKWRRWRLKMIIESPKKQIVKNSWSRYGFSKGFWVLESLMQAWIDYNYEKKQIEQARLT